MKPVNELERIALEKYEELKAQGKNPHGWLRDILIEMSDRDENP